jgi:tetratricopeptide (TPR) repeat protein
MALLVVYQQDYKQAVAYGQTAVKMGQLWGGRGLIAEGYLALGHAYRCQGEPDQAEEVYQQARQIWAASSRLFRTAEPTAGLAQIALEQGRLTVALAFVEQILPYANSDEYAGMFERFWVDLVCYTVLHQTGDERAALVLAKTAHALWEKAHKIEDVAIREMFLQNFPAHRQIMALSGTDMK